MVDIMIILRKELCSGQTYTKKRNCVADLVIRRKELCSRQKYPKKGTAWRIL
jgi:hypothetical protein